MLLHYWYRYLDCLNILLEKIKSALQSIYSVKIEALTLYTYVIDVINNVTFEETLRNEEFMEPILIILENENDSYAVNLANKIKKPGDSASYSFVIKNYDGKLSELPIEYQINLELIGNIPIQCVLYQESVSKFAISTLDQQKNTYTGVMDITETEVHFEITIEWPSDKIDSSYYEQDAIAAVFLTIQATQID